MFGPFRPSQPLLGGLLWKIAWKMTGPQKLRQRRRLRRVDNIVAALDNALKRQAAASSTLSSSLVTNSSSNNVTSSSSTSTSTSSDIASRRHGRGPHQGEWVPQYSETGVVVPGGELLSDAARRTGTFKLLERWKAEMPTEQEMLPRDKYTMFDRKAKRYRKGLHKLPKWTRVSQRVNPPGF